MADPVVAMRMPPDFTERADVLVEQMMADPYMRAFGRISRSSTFRMALLRGLEVLEAQYAQQSPQDKTGGKHG